MAVTAVREHLVSSFKKGGALWQHDGNPKRPYALLTSGKISDFFFNGSKVIEEPVLLNDVVGELLHMAKRYADRPNIVVGPAVGAIPIVYEAARQLQPYTRAWFAEKEEGEMKIKRFEADDRAQNALLVEDVITTMGSVLKVRAALKTLMPDIKIEPVVLCIVNRSGQTALPTGEKIISILEPDAKSWERGENPFTTDGQELVEPLRPKSNWDAMNKQY